MVRRHRVRYAMGARLLAKIAEGTVNWTPDQIAEYRLDLGRMTDEELDQEWDYVLHRTTLSRRDFDARMDVITKEMRRRTRGRPSDIRRSARHAT